MTPEPTGPDPLAVIALVVAACSALITLFGFAWQLALYKLQGARLKVEIAFCYLTDHGMTLTLRGPGRRTPTFAAIRSRNDGLFYGIEYGLVRVTNIGRTPVSVENISFDLGRSQRFKLGRSTVVPTSFADADTEVEPFESGRPHRLEPGDNVTAAYHLWPTLASPSLGTRSGRNPLLVRASATAVGRRATRSSRRSAWRFEPGATSWFRDLNPPPPELRVYRRLWAAREADHVGGIPLLFHREITNQLRLGASTDDIKRFLDDHNPDGIHGITAYDVHHAFHHTAPNSFWPEEPEPEAPKTFRQRLNRALWGVSANS
ncbi:hypothetical protein SBI67_02425 [Mycolicibacterium sp. 120266]|uniref:hypothetical protein n=1 Tax=Mycolicibacterium sp. 120266 TaxID=3090601 RepID=UPI00299CF176|nr:hypothetical protein [Mycolicibacterium sp. 120266]MDX1870966.1 hypothetical protein [Mycolicibacterium sp. 120266]